MRNVSIRDARRASCKVNYPCPYTKLHSDNPLETVEHLNADCSAVGVEVPESIDSLVLSGSEGSGNSGGSVAAASSNPPPPATTEVRTVQDTVTAPAPTASMIPQVTSSAVGADPFTTPSSPVASPSHVASHLSVASPSTNNYGSQPSVEPSQGNGSTQQSHTSGLSAGAKAGIAVAAVAVVLLITAVLFLVWRQKRRVKDIHNSATIIEEDQAEAPPGYNNKSGTTVSQQDMQQAGTSSSNTPFYPVPSTPVRGHTSTREELDAERNLGGDVHELSSPE